MSTGEAREIRDAFRLGALTVRPQLGRIEGPNGAARLEPKVMELLVHLAERSGSVVSHRQIIDRVWRGTLVTDEVISRAVYQIRKAAGTSASGSVIIETIPKRGYRCIAAMQSDTVETSPAPRAKRRLAILPFENLSADPGNAFFADGLHEEILSALTSRAAGLEIISRTTMMRYRREPPKLIGELATDLGATHVIEGSVRRDGEEVWLTVQLIDALADQHVWARSYDRKIGNIMTLQSEVAGEVATQLSAHLTGELQSAALTTTDPEAYDLYLHAKLARQLLNPSRPIERFLDVERLLSASLAHDPNFALAHLERMRVRVSLIAWNYDCCQARRDSVREDLDAVRRLLPADDPLTLAAQGLYWSEANYEPERALAKYVAAEARGYSDSAFLQSKARLLLRLDRIEEALRAIRQAAVLDPGNAVLLNVSVLVHLAARKPTEAIRLSTRAIAVGAVALSRVYVKFAFTGQTQEMRAFLDSDRGALDPEYRIHLSFRALLLERQFHELEVFLASIASSTVRVGISFIGMMLAGLGQRPVAEFRGWLALLLNQGSTAVSAGAQMREFLQHTEQSDPNRWFLRLLEAEAELFAGNHRRAIETARAAVALTPRSLDAVAFIEVAYVAACIFAWSKAEEEAVTLLEELASSTPGLGPGYIARDPLCSVPLANNPRYRTLASRLEAQMRACEEDLCSAKLDQDDRSRQRIVLPADRL